MAETISMPKLGFDMAEGTLVRWVKNEGENVNKGDVLAEIETDKGHDAFLLEEPELFATVSGFINSNAERRGIA